MGAHRRQGDATSSSGVTAAPEKPEARADCVTRLAEANFASVRLPIMILITHAHLACASATAAPRGLVRKIR
jgi:hypothetical protein